MARFMNQAQTRKNKHWRCVCDHVQNGHWVSTQGNHSDHSVSQHPNALQPGYALSSTNTKYVTHAKPPNAPDRKAAATWSSAGSTIAEADLIIAKENIEALHKQITGLVAVRDDLHQQLHKSMELGNGQLSTAARTANETVRAHAKQLRTTIRKEITSNAIAKMQVMRQHAHAFAEGTLDHITAGEAVDMTPCWTAFSGLLDDTKIESADWGERRKRQASASSAAVYNTDKFNTSTGSVTMNSPAPHVAYHLTVAKVKASELPTDYEPLGPVGPIKAAFKGKGKAPMKKRKHGDIDDDKDNDEKEIDGSDMDDEDGSAC